MTRLLKYCLFTILIFSLFFTNESTLAGYSSLQNGTLAENSEWEISVIPNTDSILFEWEDIGDTYVITQKNKTKWAKKSKDGKEKIKLVSETIYNGSSTSFSHQKLDSKTRYNYEISAFDKEKNIIHTSTIEISTLKAKDIQSFSAKSNKPELTPTPKEIFEESQIISNYSDNSLKIQWINLPSDDNTFHIYVDEQKIDEVEQTDSYAFELKDSDEHLYSVIAYTKKTQEEINEIKIKAEENNVKLTDEMLEKLSYQEFKLSIAYQPPIEEFNSLAFSTQSYTPFYILEYTTFIPMAIAPNPVRYLPTKGGRIAYFHGDDRSFDPWAHSYRTKFSVNVVFSPTSKKLFYFPYAGDTIGYDRRGNIVDIDRAPAPNDMWLTNIDKSKSNQISFKMNHASANPLTFPSPDINYEVDVTVQENGSITARGWHDLAPSHEFYISAYGSDHVGILHRENHTDFNALFGITTIWSVTY
ncbi:DUF3238 domain-containing protein [Sutcliffiella horikoshii]|uniref:DUF3238 domain-containing protein n=1 Tax=Sutcliffiella horikoshii TaxID=79883 RepID=UPI003CECC14E